MECDGRKGGVKKMGKEGEGGWMEEREERWRSDEGEMDKRKDEGGNI